MLVAACATDLAVEVEDDGIVIPVAATVVDSGPGAKAAAVPSVTVTGGSTVTINGRVFFNDRRDHGLFSKRRDLGGAAGTKCGTSGSCTLNWLAAQYMVVDVIERDTGYFAPTAWDCKQEDILTSATVDYTGRFSVTFTPTDACDSDAFASPAIELRVRTKFCSSDYCFSVDIDDNKPYVLDYPGATRSSPLLVHAGETHDLPDMAFLPAGVAATTANDTTNAAAAYASLVDTVLTIHRDGGVPFFKDTYGEVQLIYPSSETATATTKTPSRIVMRRAVEWEPNAWHRGHTPAHEYGHVLMLRAWDGDYGFDGVGISANDSTRAVSQQIAFKEAWAEFTAFSVMVETEPCNAASFDDNSSTPLPGPLGDGSWWRLNIKKALCDWNDRRNDDDGALAGAGDHFDADDFYSMWFNLRNMYLQRAAYGGDYAGKGLWFCDYVDYYLEVRKSPAAVGASAHAGYVSSLTDLVYNNNIACYLPSP